MKTCMVDTCIFNWLVDGKISIDELPKDCRFVITHIQNDEILKTKDAERKERLLGIMQKISDELVCTETFITNVSRLNQAKLGKGSYTKLKVELDAQKKKANNIQDILIAETAFENSYLLLTSDRDLAAVMQRNGGMVQLWGDKSKS